MAKDELYPNERKAARILQLAIPDVGEEERLNAAYLVSQRRLTIDDAIEQLKARDAAATSSVTPGCSSSDKSDGESGRKVIAPGKATTRTPATTRTEVTASSPPRTFQQPRPRPTQPAVGEEATGAREPATARASGSATTTTTTSVAPAKAATALSHPGAWTASAMDSPRVARGFEGLPVTRNRSLDGAKGDPQHRIIHEKQENAQLIHYYYGDSAEAYETEVLHAPGQCILFTTSMTGDRRVRDHCRQMETLLYIKQIPHHVMDIADNAFLKRKAREIYRSGTGQRTMPNMPLLCVDNHYVGGFEEVQDLEDCGELEKKLAALGFHDECLMNSKPDYFDPSKREANLAIMSPNTARAGERAREAAAAHLAAMESAAAARQAAAQRQAAAERAAEEQRRRAKERREREEVMAALKASAGARRVGSDEGLQGVTAGVTDEAVRPAERGSRFVPPIRRLSAMEDPPAMGEAEEGQRTLRSSRRTSEAVERAPAYSRETRERYRSVPTWRQALLRESNFIELNSDEEEEAKAAVKAQGDRVGENDDGPSPSSIQGPSNFQGSSKVGSTPPDRSAGRNSTQKRLSDVNTPLPTTIDGAPTNGRSLPASIRQGDRRGRVDLAGASDPTGSYNSSTSHTEIAAV